MENERSTVYLDVDDDITAILGKLSQAEHGQVAMVVPKRSTVLQSVVNMKLIKKTAKEADKKPVLITEDPIIKNIAGGQQMLVAAGLSATPAIPDVEKIAITNLPSDVIEGETPEVPLSPATAGAKKPGIPTEPLAAEAKESKIDKAKKRIPDFDRFKKRFLLAVLGVIGLGLLMWALFFVWPKATITVDGRTEPLKVALSFTADSEVKNPQYNNNLLPAEYREVKKSLTKNVTPTGKKDVGTKATGSVAIKNCEDSSSQSYSPGVRFTSSSGKSYSADSGFAVPGAGVSGGSVICGESGDIPVTAVENGDSYNIGATSYTSSSFSGNYTITGSKMTGGTSKTITVVTKSDVDSAKNELASNERAAAKQGLLKQFGDEDYVIEDSYGEDVEKLESSPAIGQEADSARVTVSIKYSQMSVKKEHLRELIKQEGEKQNKGEGSDSLAVVEAGLAAAEIKLKNKVSDTAYRFDAKTDAHLGPDINFDELKERLAGKKMSEAIEEVKTYPNVNGASVRFSPFYVRKVPSNPDKVTIEIKLPENQPE